MPLRHLMVPLDGSALAESAAPMAQRIAAATGARITLLHAMEVGAPSRVHGHRHLDNAADAARYLSTVAAAMSGGGLAVDWHVHDNAVHDVAQSLAGHAVELGCDLVVMATHGHGGPKRWVYGSIAQRVVAVGSSPVLFVPCPESPPEPGGEIRSILVPLDGEPSHEGVISSASDLGAALGAAVRLITVVPMVGDLGGSRAAVARRSPRTMAAALELESGGAAEYLRSARTRYLRAEAAAGEPDLVERGDPSQEILRAAERMGPTLLVLATHRKVGVAAFWSGSVAPRVASRASCPVALIPCER